MSTLSEKYLAGFLDADGSIQVMWRAVDRDDSDPTVRRPYLSLQFSQRADRDEVLRSINASFGGKMYAQRGYSTLMIFGSPAVQVLMRIKQYLVVKRNYAEAVLALLGKPQKVELAQAYLKAQRKVRSEPLPNYPSRKWAAGYVDGDGSFSARISKNRSYGCNVVLEVASSDYDSEGIELLQKAFGGSIGVMDSKRVHLRKWTLVIPPSKLMEIERHFGQYLIVKKPQFDFLMGCARMGHFRDGKSIHAGLKQLKAQPHRLSESSVKDLLRDVRDVPDSEINRHRAAGVARAWSLRKR